METEGFYMAEKRWRTWETVGLLVVLAAGNLLHFVYDWTGQSPIAAPLAAVNESTWEHMKLFITPWVLWSLVECIALRGHGALLPARGLGLLAGLAAIPALFYTYQGILGRGIMWVDVLIFQLAVLLAFWVSWSVRLAKCDKRARAGTPEGMPALADLPHPLAGGRTSSGFRRPEGR